MQANVLNVVVSMPYLPRGVLTMKTSGFQVSVMFRSDKAFILVLRV